MDRCALFVDANYALSEGALIVHGTRNRDSVSWDYAGLLKLLGSLSRDRTGLPLLRCYWYDTGADGARAAEHEALGDIPGIKLRLSKARPSRKEGVEAEIRKDLTALARNHAVTDIVIVSAEEDLAPVISEVQDLGVRIVLFHVATEVGWANSRALRQECDDIIEIGAAHLQPYVDLIAGAEPQLPAAGFMELPGAPVQSSGPHAAIEAPAARLYGSSLGAEYEHVASAAQVRQDAPPYGGHGETSHSGPIAASADSQPGLHVQGAAPSQGQPVAHLMSVQTVLPGAQSTHLTRPAHAQPAHAQATQGQPAASLPQGQSPGFSAHVQQQPGMQSPGQPEHSQQPPSLVARAQQYQRSDAGRGHQPVATGPGGFGGQEIGGRLGQPDLPPGGVFDQRGGPDDGRGRPGAHAQSAAERLNGSGGARLDRSSVDQSRLGHGQQAPNQFGQVQFGQSHLGEDPLSQAAGQPGGGLPSGGLPATGMSANGMPAGPGGPPPAQANGMHVGGFPPQGQSQNGARPNGAPPNPMPPAGLAANGNQPGYGQPGAGQSGSGASLPQRQVPPGNGMPYGQDRSMPYGGPGQLAQPSGPGVPAVYGSSYGSQQSAVASVAMPVGDAIQSAHAEGFGFGEAVARDAPALWLEAVLARKPRMPSDLEARLLQGSALPIDSLLHDEVRHALRRGFWDALERSRH